MSEEKKSVIHARLNEVMAEIGSVEKAGRNAFQNYDYLTEQDVINAVRPLLLAKGINFGYDAQVTNLTPCGKDGKSILTTIILTATFTMVDDHTDYVKRISCGQGADAGDKGVYKAITGALKYLFFKNLLIGTGDDPEAEGKPIVRKGKSKPVVVAASGEDF